jgi:hypothetical protein
MVAIHCVEETRACETNPSSPAVSPPCARNRVRVDRQDAEKLIDAIQQADGRDQQRGAVSTAAEDVRAALGASHPVPLTYQVRIAASEAQALAQRLLSAAGFGS